MNVTELHRYPVKSMLGESLNEIQVGKNGFAGDRAWALRRNNQTLSGKKYPALMSAQASFTELATVDEGSAAIAINLPDGSQLRSTDEDIGAKLGDWLATKVELWPLVSADNLEFFIRQASGQQGSEKTPEQMEQELRAVFSRLPSEPLPDLASFPPELLKYDSPPGTYFDAYPILVMSAESLDTLRSRADNNFDTRRFRPNIVLSEMHLGSPGNAFPENDLVGKQCKLGDAVLSIEMPCPRCIMTTHPVAEVPKDPNVMRQLVTHNNGNLGVYAKVTTPGTIRCGDPLEVVAQ